MKVTVNRTVPIGYAVVVVDGKVTFMGRLFEFLGQFLGQPEPTGKVELHMSLEDFRDFKEFCKALN
jgi:hypothetical protein